jgi:(hydroxyamino)benzene mutase
MNRLQIQLGFVLILVGLFTGFGMPLYTNPRLGLAAHIVAITGGLVLIALGALARSFALAPRSSKVMMGAWVYAAYANWAACLLGAITGASRFTPIAGAGTTGTSLAEAAVAFLLQSLSVAAIAGTGLAIRGFRKTGTAPTGEPVASLSEATGS